jgi:hypothetical protein
MAEFRNNTALNWGARFHMVPADLLMDERLTSRHIHVFLALISDARSVPVKQADFTTVNRIFSRPTLDRLADKTGLAVATISRTTKDLATWGWLTKGQTGTNEPNEYELFLSKSVGENMRNIADRKLSDEDYQKIKEARAEKTAAYNRKKALEKTREREAREAWKPRHPSIEVVEAALRAYLVTGKEDPDITDEALECYGYGWGMDPDMANNYANDMSWE